MYFVGPFMLSTMVELELIITNIGSVGAVLPCSPGGYSGVGAGEWEPLRFLVAVLVREPRAEW